MNTTQIDLGKAAFSYLKTGITRFGALSLLILGTVLFVATPNKAYALTCDSDRFTGSDCVFDYTTPCDCPSGAPGQCISSSANAGGCITTTCDLSACPGGPSCGDNSCNNGETCSSCASDCGSCPPQFVNLNFNVSSTLGGPIGGASVDIGQDFGNGTHRTTGGGGFANFGVVTNNNVGWSVSASGYSSASGTANVGTSDVTVNVALVPNCVPDTSCAASTCVGSTCSDGCGGTVNGTMAPNQSCAATTCIGSTCVDSCGGTVNGTMSCPVNVAPSITQHPTDQIVTVGQTATFTAAATGNPAPTYQWQKNSSNIPGATNASYTTPATLLSDTGSSYHVVVTNIAGTATSNAAILTVNPVAGSAPVITSAANASGTVGTPFSYQITATNNPTSFSASGLPAGLSINTANGLISGTPTAAGNSNINLGATNAFGTGNRTLALSIGTVVVTPVLTSITVSPNNISISKGTNQTFTARGFDQSGQPMTLGAIVWSTTLGNVSGSGVFGSNVIGQAIRITATSAGVVGQAIVNVIQSTLDIAYAWPVPYKPSLGHSVIHFDNLTVDTKIRIYTITAEKVKELTSPNGQDITWDVKNEDGRNVASGVYLYQIESPLGEKRGKLVIIR